MKKVIALLVSMIVGSVVFAEYRGDLQIRILGAGMNSIEITKIEGVSVSGSEFKSDDISSYNFGVQSYNTWGGSKLPVKFGFSVGFDIGAISGEKDTVAENDGVTFDFTVGPAVSFKVNKVVKLETAIMLAFAGYTEEEFDCAGVGVAWDFVAEFLPEAVFSPLVGINYMSTGMSGTAGSGITSMDFDCDFSRVKFFIGGAFNFGRHN